MMMVLSLKRKPKSLILFFITVACLCSRTINCLTILYRIKELKFCHTLLKNMEMSYKLCIMFLLVYGLLVFQKKVIRISLIPLWDFLETLIMSSKGFQEKKSSEFLLISLGYIYFYYILIFT